MQQHNLKKNARSIIGVLEASLFGVLEAPTTNQQPSITHQPASSIHQPPITNYQPPNINHQLQTTLQRPTLNHQPPTNNQAPTTCLKLVRSGPVGSGLVRSGLVCGLRSRDREKVEFEWVRKRAKMSGNGCERP